ncbi:5-methyltetrahydropteroyltriglutamate--homocysteine S-methyltransferase [Rhizophagus clarus]|uniref:5-methyltetrahydropteroyltriglutamate--homocysteine S-methyltransferase n=1 Tax=Rhizophagus clarus TaxID=94130 RepID=A0A8H3L337_9GLOM|nr:5-methyltetrahydropteroyltriglutamate--homocysteine S-methyltransferase [Rhizophagus clarus]
MALATNLGFPRMGANRELKRLVENFWSGKVDENALLSGSKKLREEHWLLQKKAGLDQIPSNDFSLYDQVVDHSYAFGVIPARYKNLNPGLETYFAMCRGLQKADIDVPACEMKKWFDTNYHYIVPEFEPNQQFALNPTKILDEYNEAVAIGIQTRPVILGPISYLLLGKPARGAPQGFEPIQLLSKILPLYEELLSQLAGVGATWIQIDEPFLVTDLPSDLKKDYSSAYNALTKVSPQIKILIATYFERIGSNIDFIVDTPISALHIDLVRAPDQLESILKRIPSTVSLSLGLINGRNIWKVNMEAALAEAQKAISCLGAQRVFIAPSCSLLHTPHSLQAEKNIDSEILDWLAFATEKIKEIVNISKVLNDGAQYVQTDLDANRKSIQDRKTSPRIHNSVVQEKMKTLTPDMFKRKDPFRERQLKQRQKLGLPAFPTTTVGSFPQTKEVRAVRAKLKKEEIGMDVLVHGEFERNDMVEFFGENLQGYVFSGNGWVQSYGSRCIKPPIIFGDVFRPKPMTVEVIKYAQSLTKKPLKGMLTGPVTMLQWSFVRDDQPRKDTTFQLALAIREEVRDLEAAGISVIQIDEPAIREGLPLRKEDWNEYLNWAVDAFLLSSTGVDSSTQIHTHMCYSDFNDIIESIQRMDADVITIENSRSDLKLLHAFEKHEYTNEIGPGLYDIHSPRVPSKEELETRLQEILKYISKDLTWVNPDCGLKTRGWPEVEAALKNLTDVAKGFRTIETK